MLCRRLPPKGKLQALACLIASLGLTSCARVDLHEGGSLASCIGMTPAHGSLTKEKFRVDSAFVSTSQTVHIVPTSMSGMNTSSFSSKNLALLTKAIDRSLCAGLSERFKVVGTDQPADLSVHATITGVVPTNQTAAAASTVASLGASVALAVSVPRLPIGLGGLSVDAEAIAPDGSQKAALLWSEGANMLTTNARASAIGDAYSLSSAFGRDFSTMLAKGQDPLKNSSVLPSSA